MNQKVYVGVDDTDIIGSVGTGKIARGLAARLVEMGLADSLGVSRHQLLVDERIKYTSHNSAKGLAVITDKDITELFPPAVKYLSENSQKGSDPGLCICAENQVNDEIIAWGKRAVTEVLTKEDAVKLAKKHGIFLKGLGGDDGGMIGALAAVGLRAWGNEGRLVDLPGIQEIKGLITVAELLSRTPIDSVREVDGKLVGKNEIIDSLDWIRPSLVEGRPVLRVKPGTSADGKRVWLSIEKRNRGDD